MKIKLFLVLGPALVLSACDKNPVDRLINPLPDGTVSQTSGIYVVYDDELRTGGGLGMIPYDGNQDVSTNDFSSPRRTMSHMRYTWNGGDVLDGSTLQHLFAGFSLPITSFLADIPSAQPKNLNVSGAGYAQVRFYIRGALSDRTWVRVEGPDDGNSLTATAQVNSRRQGDSTGGDFVLTNEWQEISFAVPSGHFGNVKTYLTVSLQFSQPSGTTQPGEGGTIYLDDIRYVQ